MAQNKRFWIGGLISLALLAYSVHGIDWPRLWESMANAQWRWLLLALPLYLGGYWSRARRISQILDPVKKISTSRSLPPLVIGFMFNNILPARMGEFVFAYLLGKREGISRTASLAAVVISRILDGFTILVFFLFGLFAFLSVGQAPPAGANALIHVGGMEITQEALIGKIYLAGILGGLMFGLVFAGCFCLIMWKDFTFGIVGAMFRLLPERFSSKGLQAFEKFITGLDILKNPKALLGVFFFNFVPWGLELFTYYFTAKTFGIDLNLRQCSLIMGMTNLAMILPSGPGGLGLFEMGGMMVMALYGLEKTLALAYIVVVHAIILLPINVWGFYFLWREGISFSEALSEPKGKTHGR